MENLLGEKVNKWDLIEQRKEDKEFLKSFFDDVEQYGTVSNTKWTIVRSNINGKWCYNAFETPKYINWQNGHFYNNGTYEKLGLLKKKKNID